MLVDSGWNRQFWAWYMIVLFVIAAYQLYVNSNDRMCKEISWSLYETDFIFALAQGAFASGNRRICVALGRTSYPVSVLGWCFLNKSHAICKVSSNYGSLLLVWVGLFVLSYINQVWLLCGTFLVKDLALHRLIFEKETNFFSVSLQLSKSRS